MIAISDLWLNLLTGSTVAMMGCVIAAVVGGYDVAWFGAASAAALFLIAYFECLHAVQRETPGAGTPESAEADGV